MEYSNKNVNTEKADKEAIEIVFNLLEKYTQEERNVNCLSCGYGSCYDFANSVALGENHIDNCFKYSYKKISEQTEELFAQEQSLYEQKCLLEAKNEELVSAIEYIKEVEENLKVEREINEFAVQTKYELVSLIDVSKEILTVYKKSKIFELGGLSSKGDYDTAVALVSESVVYFEDREAFSAIKLNKLISYLHESEKFIFEYRLVNPEDQTNRWKRVSYRYFTSSNDFIIQLTEDIHDDTIIKTELETTNKRLILNEDCFKALAEQTNKVILEWDFLTNKITTMSNFKALFGRDAVTVNNAEDALSVHVIHEDDRDVFIKVFKTIQLGESVDDSRFRIKDSTGKYHWCTLSGLVIKDDKGVPFKAIGSLENIENQLRKEEALKQKAETDQLTGLYNKAAMEAIIKSELENYIDKNGKCALMVVDVDNFKSVNDKFGHMYGDNVLAELAEELRNIFRINDAIGRVGGDEFFVMLKDFSTDDIVSKKAVEVCNAFKKTFSVGDAIVNISVSIGIAIYPEHGEDYETLFKHADLALYDAKAKGKNGFQVYSGQDIISYRCERTEIDSRGSVQKNLKDNLIEYIFRLLYESDNEGRNIELALQFISKHFKFSRGYVFELNHTQSTLSTTFEWCAQNIIPQIENNIEIPLNTFDRTVAEFRNNGVFLVEDVRDLPTAECEILQEQGIKSMFHFGIMNKGEPVGIIGFDDCLNERKLNTNELEELKLICNVFATFLLKQRSSEFAQKNYNMMEAIFNGFEGYSYVVECDTYKVLFENSNVMNLTGESNVGKYCYEVYMNKSEPCKICAINGLSNDVTRSSMEIDNKKYGIVSRTTATKINWADNKSHYLVSSIDISEYKK